MILWSISTSHLLNGLLYLDPGSGSFILQILIASLMGGLLALKIYWRKITAFFKKDKTQASVEDSKDDEL